MLCNGGQPDYDRWAFYIAMIELALNIAFWLNR